MPFKWLVKLAPVLLLLALVTACGNGGGEQHDPAGEDKAPLNQEEDNPDMNGPNEDDPHLENEDTGRTEDRTDSDRGEKSNNVRPNNTNKDHDPAKNNK